MLLMARMPVIAFQRPAGHVDVAEGAKRIYENPELVLRLSNQRFQDRGKPGTGYRRLGFASRQVQNHAKQAVRVANLSGCRVHHQGGDARVIERERFQGQFQRAFVTNGVDGPAERHRLGQELIISERILYLAQTATDGFPAHLNCQTAIKVGVFFCVHNILADEIGDFCAK